ncbi:MAG: hypothetical protein DSY80_05965 [Desulfocapsa sp.]|nr:MAG: hypothetical protein DSY80_05965 [Desulfocapsa sp.]
MEDLGADMQGKAREFMREFKLDDEDGDDLVADRLARMFGEVFMVGFFNGHQNGADAALGRVHKSLQAQ